MSDFLFSCFCYCVCGSLASLIILLVWLYLCGNILLLGAAVSRTWVIRRTR